ncbi:MAG TPA: MBL fold metallo-hydrolase [Mycobacteriales bacterium]|nr:MBL fold metallo-hydrolase [Mycobacteriales bacterium]
MRLTVAGCSGTFPGPDSACSGYLLETDGFRLLLDAGNGATGELQRTCGVLELDAVLVSHLHGDHYLDLIPLTYALRYHPAGRRSRLPVYGPPGTAQHLAAALGRPAPLEEVYDIRELGPADLDIGPFRIRPVHANHPVETFAVRITADGRSVAYSADSGVSEDLVELAGGADLFLCEASYRDGDANPPGIHLTGAEAGQHAARAGVGRLVLTHLMPWGDAQGTLAAAQSGYDGEISLAATGATFDI